MSKRKIKKSFFLVILMIFIVVITPLYLLCYGIFQWGYTMTTNEGILSDYMSDRYEDYRGSNARMLHGSEPVL